MKQKQIDIAKFIKIGFLLFFVTLSIKLNAQKILVVCAKDEKVNVVDVSIGKVVKSFPAGKDPHEIILDDNKKFAYISNYGAGIYHTITPVNLAEMKNEPAIDLSPLQAPHGLDYAFGKLWFTAEFNKAVGSIDPSNRKVNWIMGNGHNKPHMISVLGKERILVSNVNSESMSVFETTDVPPELKQDVEWKVTNIEGTGRVIAFDFIIEGKEIWAIERSRGKTVVINLDEKKITESFELDFPGVYRMKFTPDKKYALIVSNDSSDLLIVEVKDRKEIKRIDVGRFPMGILINPEGTTAWIASGDDNIITQIDLDKLKISKTIKTSAGPDTMIFLPLEY